MDRKNPMHQIQKTIDDINNNDPVFRFKKIMEEINNNNPVLQFQKTIKEINKSNPWNIIQESIATSIDKLHITNTNLKELSQFNLDFQTCLANNNLAFSEIFESIDNSPAINNWKNFIENDEYTEEKDEPIATDQNAILLNDALFTLYYFLDICTNIFGVANKRQAFWAFFAIIVQWYMYAYPSIRQTESLKQLTFQQDPPAVVFETTSQESYEFPLNLIEDDSLPFPEESISDGISGA